MTMPTSTWQAPPTSTSPPSRRAVLTTALWSVPAIAMTATSPAHAASGTPTLTLSVPRMQVPATGAVSVTALLVDENGVPMTGRPVSFTAPTGVTVSTPIPVTDSSGIATTSIDNNDRWATPGSTLTLSAVADGVSATHTATILGANAYGVGANASAQIGDGTTTDASVPVQLSLVFPSPIAQTVATSTFTLALLRDGSVWSIGGNSYGQLGEGTTSAARKTWKQVPGLADVREIAAGSYHAVALRKDGTAVAWGWNSFGQLGTGTTTDSAIPVPVSGLSNAKAIACGPNSSYAVLSGGGICAWGSNSDGQLGDGTTTSQSAPVAVQGITAATQVAAYQNGAYARLSNGTVNSWGYNSDGQLGNNSSVTRSTVPVVVSNITTATQIAAGYATGYALLSNGRVRAWGNNSLSQLGTNSSAQNVKAPVTVSGITTATKISSSGYSAYVLLSSGEVRAWGYNGSGQLGDGSTSDAGVSKTVTGIASVTALAINSASSQTMSFIR